MNIKTVGSICSGIEAASVVWEPLGFEFKWFSEIADFPSKVLQKKYPEIPNLGDMATIPDLLRSGEIDAPDLICGGTPCQAFSLAGWKKGLEDDRGNLTLQFVDIVEINDQIRQQNGRTPSVVFWENVEGVLNDKTNAFGSLISSLAGLDEVIENRKWPNAGFVKGPKRNVAWRILDAKFFGVPQQRRRLYVLAGGSDFHPEDLLFEVNEKELQSYPKTPLSFTKNGHDFEIFREYTDCLYSAYGTKWNGNAAAYNGSLYVVQDSRIRRLSPLECERLMGFPDGYTDLEKAKRTNRYQALGNSWAVPVIKWIGERLVDNSNRAKLSQVIKEDVFNLGINLENGAKYWDFGKRLVSISEDLIINSSEIPEDVVIGNMNDVISEDAPESIYISPVGCNGIVRRKNERNLKMNQRLEEILIQISNQMSPEEIEKRSRVQKRGRFSDNPFEDEKGDSKQLSLFV